MECTVSGNKPSSYTEAVLTRTPICSTTCASKETCSTMTSWPPSIPTAALQEVPRLSATCQTWSQAATSVSVGGPGCRTAQRYHGSASLPNHSSVRMDHACLRPPYRGRPHVARERPPSAIRARVVEHLHLTSGALLLWRMLRNSQPPWADEFGLAVRFLQQRQRGHCRQTRLFLPMAAFHDAAKS